MPAPVPRVIAVDLVRADRADDFSAWLQDTVSPAVRAVRPDQDTRWQVVRADEPEDGTVTFVHLFYGSDPDEWALEPLLQQALGPEGTARAMEDVREMLVQDQQGWIVTPVPRG